MFQLETQDVPQHKISNPIFEANYLTEDSLQNVGIAAGCAGVTLSFITAPLQIVKTRQQVKPHLSLSHVIRATYRPQNRPATLRNFYVGYSAHVACEGPGRVVYFVVYEYLKRMFAGNRGEWAIDALLSERMISAAVSGITCWAVIFPFDVIRARIYAASARTNLERNPSVLETARSLYDAGGIRNFYRGIGLTILRAGPVAGAVLPVYDIVFQHLTLQTV